MLRVSARRWFRFPALLCVVLGPVLCGPLADARAELKHRRSDESAEVAYLIRRGTADSLATASLLAHLTQVSDDERARGVPEPPDPSRLIARAISLAPERPELVWLQLRDCESRRCPDEARFAARLREIDAENGLAWLGDLNAALSRSPEDATRVIERIGGAPSPRVYWNQLTVAMFDALTHHDPKDPPTAITQHADDRLTHVVGVLAALDIPAFRPLAYACRPDE